MNTITRDFIKRLSYFGSETLKKAAPTIDPAVQHPNTQQARTLLHAALVALFDDQKQIAIAEAQKLLKEIDPGDLSDKINQAILGQYSEFITEAETTLEAAAVAGVQQAIVHFNITDSQMISELNSVAMTWAKDRAAELVGMKWLDGKLVENPNAEWAISDATRDQIRQIVAAAFEKETPLASIISDLEDAGPFTESRAEMIARTEVAQAQSAGNYETWKAVGVTKVKWLLSADHSDPCDCEDNANKTATFGTEFPSGDLMPPAHPNCMCVIVAVGFSD